jgi:hypothetical protein
MASKHRKRPLPGYEAHQGKGVGTGGESINPMGLPQEGESSIQSKDEICEAPSPGVPISAEKYRRLKKAAKGHPPKKSEPGQEDPSQQR